MKKDPLDLETLVRVDPVSGHLLWGHDRAQVSVGASVTTNLPTPRRVLCDALRQDAVIYLLQPTRGPVMALQQPRVMGVAASGQQSSFSALGALRCFLRPPRASQPNYVPQVKQS